MKCLVIILFAITPFLHTVPVFAQSSPCGHLSGEAKQSCEIDHQLIEPTPQAKNLPTGVYAFDGVSLRLMSATDHSVTISWISKSRPGRLSDVHVESFCTGIRTNTNVAFTINLTDPVAPSTGGTYTIEGLPQGCQVGIVAEITTPEGDVGSGLGYFTTQKGKAQFDIFPEWPIWSLAVGLFFLTLFIRAVIKAVTKLKARRNPRTHSRRTRRTRPPTPPTRSRRRRRP